MCYSKKSKKGKNMRKHLKDKFVVSVKVGPKGQITIPIEARKLFNINEGDTLMVLGDKVHGLAIVKSDVFYDIFKGKFDE